MGLGANEAYGVPRVTTCTSTAVQACTHVPVPVPVQLYSLYKYGKYTFFDA